jgi:hypothetical protein
MPDLPFVVGDLGQLFGIGADNPDPEPERVAGINKVRNALRSVPDKVKNTACVSTVGLTPLTELQSSQQNDVRHRGHRDHRAWQSLAPLARQQRRSLTSPELPLSRPR